MRVAIKDIVLSFKESGNVTQTAKLLGISRPTVQRWLKRSKVGARETYIFKGLKRKSTKPKTIHKVVNAIQRQEIVLYQQKYHFGPKKLKAYLKLNCSHMTIHRFLKKKGLVTKRPNFRRPLFQNGYAMRPINTKELGYLQMDTKHVTPELSGLPFTVYEYAGIDILSRYKVAVILPDISAESASLALQYFIKWFPFKIKYVQTDNGLEFQREFQEICFKKEINHYFIHKNSPNENAVIERSFKTDQDEFYFWLEKAPIHIGELNEWLQNFMFTYNTIRPHQSLDYKTPQEVVCLYM